MEAVYSLCSTVTGTSNRGTTKRFLGYLVRVTTVIGCGGVDGLCARIQDLKMERIREEGLMQGDVINDGLLKRIHGR